MSVWAPRSAASAAFAAAVLAIAGAARPGCAGAAPVAGAPPGSPIAAQVAGRDSGAVRNPATARDSTPAPTRAVRPPHSGVAGTPHRTHARHAAPADAQTRRPALRVPSVRRTPLEGHVIDSVIVVPHNVFEPESTSALAPVHRLANRLHITTRSSTVRRQLLFAPGDPWTDRTGRETARYLRSLDYLVPEQIVPRASGVNGDSVTVVVQTRDVWTTSPEINLESGGGRRNGSVGFTEQNLLGLGQSISADYRQDPTGTSRHLAYDDPILFRSHMDLRFGGGTGSEGANNFASVGIPWYTESTDQAWQVAWSRATSVAHLYASGAEVAHLDERMESFQAWYGVRMPGIDTITRLTASAESDNERRGTTHALPDAPPAFLGGEENLRHRLLAGELRLWRPRYVELDDIDRMDRIEDFDLGVSGSVKAGFSSRMLGSTADEGYLKLRFEGGVVGGPGFGWVKAQTSTWLRPAPLDAIHEVDGRWFFLLPPHTVVVAAHGAAGTSVSRDFQVTVGGLSGLRAYPVTAVAGRSLWRFNVEDRWIVSPIEWTLIKVGTAAFWDAARAWGPGAEGTGWYHDAGVGLRIALPPLGLSEVLRIDVAWPVSPTRDGRRQPVLSFGSSQAF